MERQSQEPVATKSLRVQILEIDLRVARVEKEEYRKLLFSLANEGAATPATSVRPASPRQRSQQSRLRADATDVRGLTGTQTPSLETIPDIPQAQSSHTSPARRERSIRAFRREFVVDIPSTQRPAHRGPPVDRPESNPLNSRDEGSEADSHVSTLSDSISISGSHENEDEGPGTLNAPQPASISEERIRALLSGLTSYQFSWGEKIRVDQTPKISWLTVSRIFGGMYNTEWPSCTRHVGYPRMLFAKITAQPFIPTSPGSRGLAILTPAWTDAQDEGETDTFPVFVCTSDSSTVQVVEYMGDYTKVIFPQMNIDWSLLPTTCQQVWLKRFSTSTSSAGRALHTRVRLRQVLGREPSVSEVRAELWGRPSRSKIRWNEIAAAFEKGEEKMRVVGVQCKRYDSFLAGKLLEHQQR